MSELEHSDADNKRHAEILYSLFAQKVTLAELQQIAAQLRCPLDKMERSVEIIQPFAIDELLELSERCTMLPELLEGGGSFDPDKAVSHLQVLCSLQELIAAGDVERTAPDTFMFTKRKTERTP